MEGNDLEKLFVADYYTVQDKQLQNAPNTSGFQLGA